MVQEMRMRSHTSPTLALLAIDLTLYILEHLEPIDIISFRKTCKAFSEITKLRTVWLKALRTIMEKHSIPESTMPLEAMTLSVLEHVALCPHRMLSLLKRSDTSPIQPMTIRLLAPRLTKAEKAKYSITDNNSLYDSYAESSGRFLASLTAYEAFTLFTIWDLGLCGQDAIKPLARYPEPARMKLYLDGFWPGPQGSNIFYLVSTHESSLLTPLSVLVHTVSMACPPEISSPAKLEIPVAAPFIFARTSQIPNTSRLVVQYEDDDDNKYFWVWDFLNNTVAALMATDSQSASAGKEMFLYYDDCIMAAYGGSVRIYNIPTLLPRDSVDEPTLCNAKIIIAAPSKSPTSFFVSHDITQSMPFYFLEVTPSRLTFFEVTSSNQLHDSKLPNKLPMAAGSVDVQDLAFWSRDQRFLSLKKVEDHLLLPSFGNTGDDSGDLTIFSGNITQIFAEGGTGTRLSKHFRLPSTSSFKEG